MGLFDFFGHDEAEGHYNNIYATETRHHEGSLTHEAIAGAAGFAAMRAYESHLRATGQQPSHSLMKEMLAGIAAAEVDKLIETKGLDWIDAHRAKQMAQEQAHHLADNRYGHGESGYGYAVGQQGPTFEYNYGAGAPFGAPGCPSYGYGAPGYGGYSPGFTPGYGDGYAGPPPPGFNPGYGGGYAGPPPPGFNPGYGGGYAGPPPPGFDQPPYGGGYPQESEGHHHHHRHHHHGS